MGINNGRSIFCVFKVDNVYFVCLKWRALLSLFVLDLSSSPGYCYLFSVSLNLNLIMGLMYLGHSFFNGLLKMPFYC